MKRIMSLMLVVMVVISITGCSDNYLDSGPDIQKLSEKDAIATLDSVVKQVGTVKIGNPEIDLTAGNQEIINEMPEIDKTYPLTVTGEKIINVEFWVETAKSGEGPDGVANEWAKKFNNGNYSGSISIRAIDPGPSIDYITNNIIPDAWNPAHPLWSKMLISKGIIVNTIEEQWMNNVAGILMKPSVATEFTTKYGEATMENIIKAAEAKDLVFGMTNPYNSDTALNGLEEILFVLNPDDPVGEASAERFRNLQADMPPPALNTTMMRNAAAAGMIDVMVMEYQAYINKTELQDYIFTPFGVPHNAPIHTFDGLSAEKQQVLQEFIDFCKEPQQQQMATNYGFNKWLDYKGPGRTLTGEQLYKAQSLWKKNKSGGRQNVAVFVCDRSGSMQDNNRMDLLQKSLINSIPAISDDAVIGLVSYSDTITIELPLDNFSGQQKSKFVSAVKAMSPNGGTSSYSAIAIALNMIVKEQEKYPNANYMVFLLTDGDVKNGINLSKIAPIIASLNINVHAIGFGAEAKEAELNKLVAYKEGFVQMIDENNVIYSIKSIFNSQF